MLWVPAMARLLDVMPFLRCADIDSAVDFFTSILGSTRSSGRVSTPESRGMTSLSC
jgi:hypothetical protein